MSAVKVEFIVVMPGLRRPSLAGQLLVLQLASIVAVLVARLGVSTLGSPPTPTPQTLLPTPSPRAAETSR